MALRIYFQEGPETLNPEVIRMREFCFTIFHCHSSAKFRELWEKFSGTLFFSSRFLVDFCLLCQCTLFLKTRFVSPHFCKFYLWHAHILLTCTQRRHVPPSMKAVVAYYSPVYTRFISCWISFIKASVNPLPLIFPQNIRYFSWGYHEKHIYFCLLHPTEKQKFFQLSYIVLSVCGDAELSLSSVCAGRPIFFLLYFFTKSIVLHGSNYDYA